jgi:hypothetical protein
VIGFLATIAGGTDRQLDASTEASGPHVFAVRFGAVRLKALLRPPRPAQRRDVGQRPSEQDGLAIDVPLFGFLEKRNIFILGLDTVSENAKCFARRAIFTVIPGRAEHEPGIHFTAQLAGQWIPGSRQEARPGMTAETNRGVGKAKRAHHQISRVERWWARRKRAFAHPCYIPYSAAIWRGAAGGLTRSAASWA